MRLRLILCVTGLCVMGAAVAGASAAAAAPSVEIRGAAARVTVIPESRGDIVVTLAHANPNLPLRIRKLGDRLYVTGDVGRRTHGCRTADGRRVVAIFGRSAVAYEQLPELLIRAPRAVRILAGEAVFGEIGRSGSVDFTNEGCGDWTIDEVQGRLRLNQAGAGDSRARSAGPTDLSVSGSGGIWTGDIRGGLKAVSTGSGGIVVASVNGPLDARIAGTGDITVSAGAVTAMTASIAGSGAVRLRGVARTLNASIAGAGDVSVTRVTGAITKQVFGAGSVNVGR